MGTLSAQWDAVPTLSSLPETVETLSRGYPTEIPSESWAPDDRAIVEVDVKRVRVKKVLGEILACRPRRE